jgi:hypothetical protein
VGNVLARRNGKRLSAVLLKFREIASTLEDGAVLPVKYGAVEFADAARTALDIVPTNGVEFEVAVGTLSDAVFPIDDIMV